eukprot:601969-Rhodomonas_salina.1
MGQHVRVSSQARKDILARARGALGKALPVPGQLRYLPTPSPLPAYALSATCLHVRRRYDGTDGTHGATRASRGERRRRSEPDDFMRS